MSNQPSRPWASANLTYGLVSVGVSIYAATDDVKVTRNEFTADGVPCGRATTRKDTGEVITSDQVVKMAQATNGALVPLGNDEIAAIVTPADRCVIETLIPLDTIGTVYLTESWYQVRPRAVKGVVHPNVDKAFALLMAVLAEREQAALVLISLRGAPKYAAVLPDGRMATLRYVEGIRDPLPLPEVEIDPKMLDMAHAILDTMGEDTPTLADTATPRLQAYIDAKVDGGTLPPAPTAPVTSPDLMDALMKSVETAKAKGETPVKPTRKPKPKKKAA